MENIITLLPECTITKREGFRSHPMPSVLRDRSMYLANSETSNINPWWAAIAAPLLLFLGAVLKTMTDLWHGRDNSQAKFRGEIIAWNERQEARIIQLENNVQGEQVLRHEIKGQLHKEQMAHELLKAEHAHTLAAFDQVKHDLEALRIEHAALKVAYDKQCGAQGIQGVKGDTGATGQPGKDA